MSVCSVPFLGPVLTPSLAARTIDLPTCDLSTQPIGQTYVLIIQPLELSQRVTRGTYGSIITMSGPHPCWRHPQSLTALD